MKQFKYRARNDLGATVDGLIESVSLDDAAKTLQEKKLLVINLSEKKEFDLTKITIGKKISSRDLAQITRLLSTMLSTGLPLTEALEDLVSQYDKTALKEVLQTVSHDIQSGVSLSDSMAKNPKVFDDLYVNLVKAGEASGKVDEALGKLADTLEFNLDFQSKVKGAMTYPAVIVVAMSVIGVFMITTIIPKISDVYKQFNADLPVPTKILIGISDILTNYTVFVVVVAVLLYIAFGILKKNQKAEYVMNNLMFKIPVMGKLSEETSIALFCRTLGTLLSSGVAILDAIKIVAKIVANNKYRAGLNEAATFVEKGFQLSEILKRNPDFPIMMSQLVAIGEETGTVDQSLERVAKFYQDSAERKVKTLTTLLEPMLILLMGGMVGGLAIAVLLPMFNLVNIIK